MIISEGEPLVTIAYLFSGAAFTGDPWIEQRDCKYIMSLRNIRGQIIEPGLDLQCLLYFLTIHFSSSSDQGDSMDHLSLMISLESPQLLLDLSSGIDLVICAQELVHKREDLGCQSSTLT